MNDHELGRALRAFHVERTQVPDPPALHEGVFALPFDDIPQRRSWLQPIDTGTFQPLFTATKFVVAGVIVALFGGFLLAGVVTTPPGDGIPAAGGPGSAEPSTTQDAAGPDPATSPKEDIVRFRTPIATALAVGILATPAIGLTAQSEGAEISSPVEFTSQVAYTAHLADGLTEAIDDGRVRTEGLAWRYTVTEASDRRLEGTMILSLTRDYFAADGGIHFELGAFRIENDGGAWQETPAFSFDVGRATVDRSKRTAHVGAVGVEGDDITIRSDATGDRLADLEDGGGGVFGGVLEIERLLHR